MNSVKDKVEGGVLVFPQREVIVLVRDRVLDKIRSKTMLREGIWGRVLARLHYELGNL